MSLSTNNMIPSVGELQSYKMMAEVAANNPYWKKLGGGGSQDSVVATIFSVMLLAKELGISPMQAISGGINNIQGKFEISARFMNQLIRKHGHQIAIKSITNELCVIWTKRKDTGEEHEEKYHIEEAIRSNLVKEGGPWKKTPSDMLFARCISRLARRIYADCLGGCYVEGELQESIQGKSLSSDEISDLSMVKSEMEIKLEPTLELTFPEHINSEEAMQFLKECVANSPNSNLEVAKKNASKNMEGFIKAFEKWKQKTTLDTKQEEIA
jgi:hypothetical protein